MSPVSSLIQMLPLPFVDPPHVGGTESDGAFEVSNLAVTAYSSGVADKAACRQTCR